MPYDADEYATEERLYFEVGVYQHVIVVVSGYGSFNDTPTGPEDDDDDLDSM